MVASADSRKAFHLILLCVQEDFCNCSISWWEYLHVERLCFLCTALKVMNPLIELTRT